MSRLGRRFQKRRNPLSPSFPSPLSRVDSDGTNARPRLIPADFTPSSEKLADSEFVI